jgi:biotin synthase
MKALDVDMIGMGPYVPCPATPLYAVRQQLWSPYDRFRLSLRMIALARLLMPSINIASTTALHALEEEGQEAGIQAGANVWMPVYTPSPYRAHYALYDRPFSQTTEKKGVLSDVIKRLGRHGETIAYNDYGDSRRYLDKQRIKHQTG